MNQMIINSTTIGVVISVMGYELGLLLKRKFKSAIFNPLLISIIFVICCLLLFRVDYDNYNKSAQYLKLSFNTGNSMSCNTFVSAD